MSQTSPKVSLSGLFALRLETPAMHLQMTNEIPFGVIQALVVIRA